MIPDLWLCLRVLSTFRIYECSFGVTLGLAHRKCIVIALRVWHGVTSFPVLTCGRVERLASDLSGVPGGACNYNRLCNFYLRCTLWSIGYAWLGTLLVKIGLQMIIESIEYFHGEKWILFYIVETFEMGLWIDFIENRFHRNISYELISILHGNFIIVFIENRLWIGFQFVWETCHCFHRKNLCQLVYLIDDVFIGKVLSICIFDWQNLSNC